MALLLPVYSCFSNLFVKCSISLPWNFTTDGGCRLIARHFQKWWNYTWPFLQAPKEPKLRAEKRAEGRAASHISPLGLNWGTSMYWKLGPTLNTYFVSCTFGSSRHFHLVDMLSRSYHVYFFLHIHILHICLFGLHRGYGWGSGLFLQDVINYISKDI